MPSRVFLPLKFEATPLVKLTQLRAAVSSHVIRETDDEHHANRKPYVVSPIAFDDDVGWGFAVRFLTDSLAERALNNWASLRSLRLGQNEAQVSQGARIEAWSSWDWLSTPDTARSFEDLMHLRLDTPTAFRSGDSYLPLSAQLVVGSLQRSWELWGPELPTVNISALHMTTDLRGCQLVSVPLGRRQALCTVGDPSIEFHDLSGSDLDILARLVALCDFTAIGAHTTSGLGLVSLS